VQKTSLTLARTTSTDVLSAVSEVFTPSIPPKMLYFNF
jgi:hypothetical protein